IVAAELVARIVLRRSRGFVSQNRFSGGEAGNPGGDGGAWGLRISDFGLRNGSGAGWRGGGMEVWKGGGTSPGSRLSFFPAQRAPAILPCSGRPGVPEGLKFVEGAVEF